MRLPSAVTRKISAQALTSQKHAPSVLFGVGVISMVGSTVLACRATLKLEAVVDQAKSDLDTANSIEVPQYSDQDRAHDTAIIYARGAGSIAKLYAPSIIVGGIGIACLTKSHNILNDRVTALSAAYAAVSAGYEKYREKVIEKYGEEQDREFRQQRDVIQAPGPDGKVIDISVVSPDGTSPYAKFFDQLSPNWSKDPEYNYAFLLNQQNWANDKLRMQGHLFLNEVYDGLGIPRTRAGSVVGWSLSGNGDNYVDFGIFDDNAQTRAFVNGLEGSVLLDFNVDGVIIDFVEAGSEVTAWQS
ncbi:MAG TPA: DUF6353 family protein [Nitrospira sp.]|nr:DUF6353 family protein [Nitrospira sp.]